jgi:hypothetical protein
MSWGLSILAGVLTAAVGAFAAGFTAERHTDWHAMSSFEGSSGYFVVFMGLLGLVAGFAVGVLVSRFQPSFGLALATSTGAVAAICVVVATLSRITGEAAPTRDGERANLKLELRTPAGWQPDNATRAGRGCFRLIPRGGREENGTFSPWKDHSQQSGETWVLSAHCALHSSTRDKEIAVTLGKTAFRFAFPHLASRLEKDKYEWREDWTGIPASGGFSYRWKLQNRTDAWHELQDQASRREKDRRELVARKRNEAAATSALEWAAFMYEEADQAADEARLELAKQQEELVPFLGPGSDFAQLAVVIQAYRRVASGEAPPASAALNEAVLRAGDAIEKEILDLNASSDPTDPDIVREKRAQQTFRAWQACIVRPADRTPRIRAYMERIQAAAKAGRLEGDLNDIVHSAKYDLDSH